MQCKEVEVVLEREGFVPVPEAARAHLSGCSSCRSLIADLTDIVATAHMLPADVEPPPRVWTSLRSQLEAEGIIRSAATRSGWLNFSEFFRPRVWATAAVGLLIVAAAALQFQRPTTQPTEARAYENIYENTSLTLSNDERSEEHTSELQSQFHLVCRLLLEKKKKKIIRPLQLTLQQKKRT